MCLVRALLAVAVAVRGPFSVCPVLSLWASVVVVLGGHSVLMRSWAPPRYDVRRSAKRPRPASLSVRHRGGVTVRLRHYVCCSRNYVLTRHPPRRLLCGNSPGGRPYRRTPPLTCANPTIQPAPVGALLCSMLYGASRPVISTARWGLVRYYSTNSNTVL